MGKRETIPYGEKELADIEHKKAQAAKDRTIAQDPLGRKEPHLFEDMDTGERFQTHYGDQRVLGHVRELKPGMTPLPEIDEMVKGIADETVPPTMPSKRGIDYNTTIARARKLGVNLQEKTLKFDMLKDQSKHLASNQTELFITSAREMGNYADKVINIAKDMDLGPMRLWNWGKLKYLAETGGNSPEAIKAREYVSAVVSAKALLARIDSTGFAPTTDAWKVAHEQLDEKLPVGQVTAQISTIRDMTNYRLEAINEMRKDALAGKTEIPLAKTKGGGGKQQAQDHYNNAVARITQDYADDPDTLQIKLRQAKKIYDDEVANIK